MTWSCASAFRRLTRRALRWVLRAFFFGQGYRFEGVRQNAKERRDTLLRVDDKKRERWLRVVGKGNLLTRCHKEGKAKSGSSFRGEGVAPTYVFCTGDGRVRILTILKKLTVLILPENAFI